MVMKERNNSDAIKNWKPNASAPLWDEVSENEPKGPFFTDLDIKHIKHSNNTADSKHSNNTADSKHSNNT